MARYCTIISIKYRAAGPDTTPTAAQSTLLTIALNFRVYQNQKSEIEAAVVATRDSEAKQLPYLQTCVLEGLRKFPPLS